MRVILVLVLSIFLTGCSLFQKRVEPPAIQPQIVNLDSQALEPCALLEATVTITTFDDIVNAYISVADKYATCANKQSTSIKLLKQFGNIK